MSASPGRGAVISGLGISRIGRRTGIPAEELTAESSQAALEDAGLTAADIDGVLTLGDTPPRAAARRLGIDAQFTGGGTGDSGLLVPVGTAAERVTDGSARHVLVYRTVQMLGGGMVRDREADAEGGGGPGEGGAAGEGLASLANVMFDADLLLAANAFSAANWLALNCRRHMDLYGTTKEQLGWLAITSRQKAGLNPLAVYRQPITMDDYLSARPVSTPFGLLDCDVPVDGSIALVISHPGYCDDGPNPAVRIDAVAGTAAPGGWYHRPDYPAMASVNAAATLWDRTDLRPADIDVAELYDGFSFLTLAWLEALGLCAQGESGPFVEGGTRIGLDGELPLNTYGGQMSAGRMHGYWILHEAVLQLRGQAAERQVPGNPEVAVAAVGGGPIAGCMLLTR